MAHLVEIFSIRNARNDFDSRWILQTDIVFDEKIASISLKPCLVRNSSPISSERFLKFFKNFFLILENFMKRFWDLRWSQVSSPWIECFLADSFAFRSSRLTMKRDIQSGKNYNDVINRKKWKTNLLVDNSRLQIDLACFFTSKSLEGTFQKQNRLKLWRHKSMKHKFDVINQQNKNMTSIISKTRVWRH